MSSFSVAARRLTILDHPNADALEIAKIDGTDFTAVVKKDAHKSGDLVVYIPTAAVVPHEILEELGLWGKEKVSKSTGETRIIGALAGPDGNRVKAIRLRSVLSEGLTYTPNGRLGDLIEGEDYAEALGIVKWQPPIPSSLAGEVDPCPEIRTYTDIENLKYFPEVFADGEEVIATEKVHGTMSLFSLIDGEFHVSSKGLAGKGLVIRRDETPDGRTKNTYWRIAERFGIEAILRELADRLGAREVSLFGETYGSAIQDLAYGAVGELDFRAFDLRVDGRFADFDRFTKLASEAGLAQCPVLYRGPYSREAVDEVAVGRETITGTEAHVREGVIVRPPVERTDDRLGRVILKNISPDYLTRKGGTEYE